MEAGTPIIRIEKLGNHLGDQWVHKDLDLTIDKGETIGIIGASGCGKTTLIRTILMLRTQTTGTIEVFGRNIAECSPKQAQQLRQRWGVMFQSGALFGALTVLENVMFPMKEFTHLSPQDRAEIALLKIILSGLDSSTASKYPAELSGGMRKRAALARAIAMDPELVFLDEPTAGLDPKSAGELDELILHLKDSLGITFVIITHDLDTLRRVPDHIIFMGRGKILAKTDMASMIKQTDPLIREYFSGPRGVHGQ